MIARLAGVISAPPIPCTARAAMSHPMPGAAAHSTGARVNQFARAGAVSRAHLARLSIRIWCHWPDLHEGSRRHVTSGW